MFDRLRRLYREVRVFTREDAELGWMLAETVWQEGVVWCVGYELAVIGRRLTDGYRAGRDFCERWGASDGG